ncbi:MAG: hypothetical protein ACRED3_17910 [Bradyrhizobium sp.]
MSEKLLTGLLLALMAVILPAFAAVLPRDAVVQPKSSLRLTALDLSAPQTIAAVASPRLQKRDEPALPPVEVTGQVR